MESGAALQRAGETSRLQAAQVVRDRPIDHPVGLIRRKGFDLSGRYFRRGYVWAANRPTAEELTAMAAAQPRPVARDRHPPRPGPAPAILP